MTVDRYVLYYILQEEGSMGGASDCDEHWDFQACGTHMSSRNIGKPSPGYWEWNVVLQHELEGYLEITQNMK